MSSSSPTNEPSPSPKPKRTKKARRPANRPGSAAEFASLPGGFPKPQNNSAAKALLGLMVMLTLAVGGFAVFFITQVIPAENEVVHEVIAMENAAGEARRMAQMASMHASHARFVAGTPMDAVPGMPEATGSGAPESPQEAAGRQLAHMDANEARASAERLLARARAVIAKVRERMQEFAAANPGLENRLADARAELQRAEEQDIPEAADQVQRTIALLERIASGETVGADEAADTDAGEGAE